MVAQYVSLFRTLPHSIDRYHYNIYNGQKFKKSEISRQQMLWKSLSVWGSNTRADTSAFDLSHHSSIGNLLLRSHQAVYFFSRTLLGCLCYTVLSVYIHCNFDRNYFRISFLGHLLLGIKNLVDDRLHRLRLPHSWVLLPNVHPKLEETLRSCSECGSPRDSKYQVDYRKEN